MELVRPTWVEVNLNSIKNNFLKIKKKVSKSKVIGVVKADAYGHGAVEVSKVLERNGIDFLAVASLEEALLLRENGISRVPILVLGYINPSAFEEAAQKNIHITLFNMRFLEKLQNYTEKTPLNVHINVDTGMGRIGVFPDEVLKVAKGISTLKNVCFYGIYTHFSTADNDLDYMNFQKKVFEKILSELKNAKLRPVLIHTANSAAILTDPSAVYDAVRPGIILYGLSPFQKKECEFEPALSFKTRIVYVKKIPPGTSISYGRRFISKKEMTVATVPAGYADGVPRALSNKGEFLVKGRRARILGNVTMDQTVIDVTGFPDIHSGNEVVIIGKQGKEKITATEVAEKAGTINYEIVSRIGKRVERIYKNKRG